MCKLRPFADGAANGSNRPQAVLRYVERKRSTEILSIYKEAAAALMRLLVSARLATIVDQPLVTVVSPPSTIISCPLTKLEPSLAR